MRKNELGYSEGGIHVRYRSVISISAGVHSKINGEHLGEELLDACPSLKSKSSSLLSQDHITST